MWHAILKDDGSVGVLARSEIKCHKELHLVQVPAPNCGEDLAVSTINDCYSAITEVTNWFC
jgi:hypothetical protein